MTALCVLDGCGRKFQYDPRNLRGSAFPFCSRRCQGVDLGNWVDETYRIEGGELDELDAGVAGDGGVAGDDPDPVIEPGDLED